MDNNHVEFNSLANKLLAETNAEKVITILLSKLINDKKEVDVELSFEKPLQDDKIREDAQIEEMTDDVVLTIEIRKA